MTTSAQTAPSHGFANAVAVTVESTNRRNPFSAASTTLKGLSRSRTLMAFAASHTMKKTSIAADTNMPFPSHERSIAARKPCWPSREVSGSAGGKRLGIPLIRCPLEPSGRLFVVVCCALFGAVHQPEVSLRLDVPPHRLYPRLCQAAALSHLFGSGMQKG